ncbi:hypothetical protein CES86_2421 [Brucella lupini]|uniref:Uncharacterized protein n=1 Tax=Brucella lupini TaxID=255457 RepID=A0A256GSU7_9HYPH|nr:hypothetical protein CES86_2421 [Brucella lupini]
MRALLAHNIAFVIPHEIRPHEIRSLCMTAGSKAAKEKAGRKARL